MPLRRLTVPARRFPPAWSVEEIGAAYIVTTCYCAALPWLSRYDFSFVTVQQHPGPPTTPNNQTAQPRNPNAGQGTLYNQGNNQARPQQRRGTTGYTH
jgi:hypothetical protein